MIKSLPMKPTLFDQVKFGEPKMRIELSGKRGGGIEAGEIVHITHGEKKGQKGLIFLMSLGGRAFIQFEDGTEGLYEPHQYEDVPAEMYETELANKIRKIRDKLNI